MQRLALEGSLRRAIEREEFVLHYQPLIELGSGQVYGAEALIRWQHSENGLLPPGQFIPLAESTKLIVALGSWTLRAACAQARVWQDGGRPGMSVAVNVSARQLREVDISDEVARTLAETGLPSSSLHIEITEGMAMQNLERSVATLKTLRDLGVRISVDDFGTGYSSLSYLRRLPVDTVKLDRSFVSGLGTNLDDAAIAEAVIAMAHSLKLEVVAEGVETKDQLRFLRAHRCEAIQGFLFSPAVTAQDMGALLAEGRSLRLDGLEPSG
jgi:EAL domain-containing protein (putative c-di-GMP-specific phosphodiesterase class I)